jgi:autotransporter translocation and assembly factor TamB
MTLIRRIVHVLAWAGTLVVLLVALTFIASQTPWFRDWIRRAVVREAKQYLNGELTIGRLSGNLFFGVSLSDVAIDVSGDRVVAVKTLAVDYSVFHLLSKGILVDKIALTAPSVHATRDKIGWNLGALVKKQEREADRQGPRRSISLPAITITDAVAVIDDRVGSTAYTLPHRIDNLNLNATFDYEPVHYTVTLNGVSFRATDPALELRQLKGALAVRDDNLYIQHLSLETGESSLTLNGVVEHYLQNRVIKLTTAGNLSMPEMGRIVPALSGYPLHPTLAVTTNGPADRLFLELDVRSEAGWVRGQLTTDLMTPDLRFAGPLHVERLNLAPIFKSPTQKSDITGDTRFDITIASAPATAPVIDRLSGGFTFRGPHASMFGYEATKVAADGAIKGPRVNLAAAAVTAYGSAATTKGVIVIPGVKRPIEYDLEGTATHLDVYGLPAIMKAPKLKTDLTVAGYHAKGKGTSVTASVTFKESIVEGATIADGTVATFESANDRIAYSGKGTVSGLNVRRLGKALNIASLDDPRYDGRVNGTFDVSGTGTTVAGMTLNAAGTLTDSSMVGTHVPEMTFKTTIANAALSVTANGAFDQLNPKVVTERDDLEGNVNGRVDGTFGIPDLTAPITPAGLSFDGHITLGPSLIRNVQVAAADAQGRYQSEVADLQRLAVKGPDVTLEASGRLALDRTSSSNLKYHVQSSDITAVGELAGQKNLDGSVVFDGTITGNAASLQTTGTLNGSGLAYGENKALDLNSKYTVTIPDLDFVNSRVEATTESTFVSIGAAQINKFTATTTYAQKQLEFSTKFQEHTREVDARGTVIFHPDHQEIHLPEFALRTEGVEWRSAPGSKAAIQYGQDRLSFQDVRLVNADQTLEVSGSIEPKGDQPTGAIDVHAQNVDLTQIEKLLMQEHGFSGRLTADAKITGRLNRPIVDGKFEIKDGGFQSYTYQSLTATVGYTGDRIALDATLQQAPDVAITARGTVPMTIFQKGAGEHVAATPEDTIDVRVQTPSINLAIIQGFTTQVANVQGTLQADVRVVGSGRDPHLQGFVEIKNGAFSAPRLGTTYTGFDTRIDLENDRVTIRKFQALDEHRQPLNIGGQLAVHEGQVGSVDISIDSHNFELIDNELGDADVDSNLKVTGELLRPRIEGDVRVVSGRLEVDKIMQLFYDPYRVEELPDIVSAESKVANAGSAQEATKTALRQASQVGVTPQAAGEAAEAAAPPSGIFNNIALNLRVRIPDNFVLRGRRIRPGGPTRAAIGDMNITVGGDLDIRKEAGGPVTLGGVVNTVRGTYQFQGRQFELQRDGTIRFTGEAELNPVLDISATRQIPDTGVVAKVHVTGSAKSPELELSSTPPLDESDILSLIVFNRSINDLGTGERASLAATAGGIATGFIATPLGQSIGRALDLDLFELTTTTEGDTLGAGITLGEQVGDRTFIKLRQQFGDRASSEFLLEYRLADFLRLEASGSPETSGAANRIGQQRVERAGINLIFFFSY